MIRWLTIVITLVVGLGFGAAQRRERTLKA